MFRTHIIDWVKNSNFLDWCCWTLKEEKMERVWSIKTCNLSIMFWSSVIKITKAREIYDHVTPELNHLKRCHKDKQLSVILSLFRQIKDDFCIEWVLAAIFILNLPNFLWTLINRKNTNHYSSFQSIPLSSLKKRERERMLTKS